MCRKNHQKQSQRPVPAITRPSASSIFPQRSPQTPSASPHLPKEKQVSDPLSLDEIILYDDLLDD